tara:strand:+ start:4094 stop:4396 length:303 start_codon:yes stop_codon:yes gene_type:complete
MEINFNQESIEDLSKEKVSIVKQQRNGKKCWTFIENFSETLDKDEIKKFIKKVKKQKCCNGSFDSNTGIIQLQGDCVEYIKGVLIENYNFNSDDIITKGV